MGTALLNTVMGISIVFIVLLLISGIIGLFKYINKAEMASKQKNKTNALQNETVSLQPTAVENVDLTDDLELVAVITAAIHAYEASKGNPVPANGLYVRSIRKVNKSRWQNA
jgi:sodium pump decarboxylase gamma subunit|nr:OadG family protein [uncultured Lachnoclostridium sp.]